VTLLLVLRPGEEDQPSSHSYHGLVTPRPRRQTRLTDYDDEADALIVALLLT